MPHYSYDANHVRYELVSSCEGKPFNWLFIPGGPGVDSSYFREFVSQVNLPGQVWLIDFPGNGSNVENITEDYDFDQWLELFLPTIMSFTNPVIIGHSFGGALPLLFPEMENHLKGFVILNAAPSLWLQEAVIYAKQFNVSDLSIEMRDFTLNPNDTTFKIALDACMPYYFPPRTLEQGRKAILSVPLRYQPAVWWQRKAIETNYSAKWVPQNVPTLIVSGTYDCIAPYTLFQRDERFKRPNIQKFHFDNAGHVPWLDDPVTMKKVLEEFAEQLYRNNLKNREFGEEAPQNFDSERATIAEWQGASESQNSEEKPTLPKPDSSSCFGI